MTPFTSHTGICAALPRVNVDTDQIIPKQFLKRIERTGFGPSLFYDWRYRADGSPDPAFSLNAPKAKGATILLAGANFGCGSSREHAPWALGEYGFRSIVAESFADIFFNNCCQNGILPVQIPGKAMIELFSRFDRATGPFRLTVDLERCILSDGAELEVAFQLDSYRRDMMLRGLDEIGLTLTKDDAIAAFERDRARRLAGVEE